MTQPPEIPVRRDTPPEALRSMAEEWLYGQAEHDEALKALLVKQGCFGNYPLNDHIPDEWLDALALDLGGAISDRFIEWLETLKEGRPPTEYVAEWEARDLDERPQAAAEMQAEMRRAREEMGA